MSVVSESDTHRVNQYLERAEHVANDIRELVRKWEHVNNKVLHDIRRKRMRPTIETASARLQLDLLTTLTHRMRQLTHALIETISLTGGSPRPTEISWSVLSSWIVCFLVVVGAVLLGYQLETSVLIRHAANGVLGIALGAIGHAMFVWVKSRTGFFSQQHASQVEGLEELWREFERVIRATSQANEHQQFSREEHDLIGHYLTEAECELRHFIDVVRVTQKHFTATPRSNTASQTPRSA